MSNKPLQPISQRKMELIFDFLNEGSFWEQGDQLLYPVDGKLKSVKVKAFQFVDGKSEMYPWMIDGRYFIAEIDGNIEKINIYQKAWIVIQGQQNKIVKVDVDDVIHKDGKIYIVGDRFLQLTIGY